MEMDDILSIAGLVIQFITIVGIIAAIWQVREAREALRAQSLLKLVDEWKNTESYRSISYINRLRREWKEKPIEEWDNLAEKWVQSHVHKDINSNDPNERQLAEEWLMRRSASQFISKMGLLVSRKYLDEEDLFRVDPEIGRQLLVIIPIDRAIQKYFENAEGVSVSEWDNPAAKWELAFLLPRYIKWYNKKGHRLFSIDNINLSELIAQDGK